MRSRFVAITGVTLATILFLIAAARFPGYRWTGDYISTLLRAPPDQSLPWNVRAPAIGAVLCYSAGLGLLFYQLAAVASLRWHRKTIQIAGIASMVYASFAMTPMHDLMVTLSFVSYVIAAIAILHWLYVVRSRSLLCFGGVSLATLGLTTVLYYGGSFGPALSVTQKLSTALCTTWLLLHSRCVDSR